MIDHYLKEIADIWKRRYDLVLTEYQIEELRGVLANYAVAACMDSAVRNEAWATAEEKNKI